MSPAELREACFHAAGTAVVGYVLGAGYDDIRVNDGWTWPAPVSQVDLTGWKITDGDRGEEEPPMDRAYEMVAAVHEAGGLAALKHGGLGAHQVNFVGIRTVDILDDPNVWAAVEPLAAYIEDTYEGDGCYGARHARRRGRRDQAAASLSLGCMAESMTIAGSPDSPVEDLASWSSGKPLSLTESGDTNGRS